MEPSIGELVATGIKLMLIGMSIVFLFLALLVWVIQTTSKLMLRFSPESQPHVPVRASVQPRADVGSDDAELVAIISAAIHQHQNK